MSQQALILFRSTNFDGKSKLIYEVPSGISLKNKEISLQSFSFYNSFFNISAAIGNNKLTFAFPVFSATVAETYTMTNYVMTIADGFYSFADLQFAIQQFMISAKLCLYNATTAKYMYFFHLLPNTVQYSVQLQTYYVPTASQAAGLGFSLLSGSPLRLNISVAASPRIVAPRVTFNNDFGKVIGYDGATFPSTVVFKNGANYDANPAATNTSTKTPYINPIDCILLRCNVANNVNSIPNDLLSVTPISSQYGAITQYTASYPLYVPCAQTTVTRIEITMCDQNLVPVLQRDAEITMVLSIRDAPR